MLRVKKNIAAVSATAMALTMFAGMSSAKADVVAAAWRQSSIYSTIGFLPLNDAGNTALAFNTTVANQRIIITYNAVCQSDYYLYLSIYVDGKAANPPGAFTFCSADSYGDSDYVGASRQAIYTIGKKGAHSVTISAQQSSGSYYLTQTSLVIEK